MIAAIELLAGAARLVGLVTTAIAGIRALIWIGHHIRKAMGK
ncbi:MAG: hypothetical protein ACTHKN_04565 [Achromobacter mucicolens]